jgi:hypothetical protein
MKNLIKLLLCLMLSSQAFAVCDSTDIKKNDDGSYNYGKDCHIEVGHVFKELDIRRQQIEELKDALVLKDSLTVKLEQRNQLWMDTSFKLNDKIQSYEKYKSDNQWISFGLGALTVILSGWALGQASKATR